MKIAKTYWFESAHHLPLVGPDHQCRRLHGHTYRLDVVVVGELDGRGFVVDFFELDAMVDPLLKQVDHRLLNDVPGLENPTAERIALWFFDRLVARGIACETVRIWENDSCYAEAGRA